MARRPLPRARRVRTAGGPLRPPRHRPFDDVPRGAPAYTGRDLAEDPLRVLDAVGASRAHLVGLSMGGAITQQLAIEHPERVASATLVSTSRVVAGPDGPPPAPPSAELSGLWSGDGPDPDDPEALVDSLVEVDRALTGRGRFDADRTRAIARRAVARSTDAGVGDNHLQAPEGEPVRGTLGDIAVPTLVVHGAVDPLFPGHGAVLAAAVPGASLLVLEDVGHQVPPPSSWDVLLPALERHLTAARRTTG
ncbi:alpha/beta fold hydrolase [Isoptericola jiangsuensis]|uniref:alpha/beta fold hydrolase n=1 Tax=Isoptericola jiangsuensis TaxID=548579 RepID=UPI003AABAFC5